MEELRNVFFAGLAAVFPLALTIYIVVLLFQFADNIAGRYLDPLVIRAFGFPIPGLGFITLVVLIIVAGLISTQLIGKRFFLLLDAFLNRLPFVGRIYPSVKKLSDYLFAFKKESLKKVVCVEFPYPGSYSLAFVIKEGVSLAGWPGMVNVFIPFAPTPLSGLVMLMPSEKVIALDVSIEDALKYFITASVISPDSFPVSNKGGKIRRK